MKVALLLLLGSVGCFVLGNTLLFLGLQVLEMNQWQGAVLGISMWSLNLVALGLFVASIWRGIKSIKNRRGAIQAR